MTDAAVDEVWRPSAAGRRGIVVFLAIWFIVALGVLGGRDASTAVMLCFFGIGGIVMAWRHAYMPFVALTALAGGPEPPVG